MVIHKKSHKIIAIAISLVIVFCITAIILYYLISNFPKGAVTTNGYGCSDIGVSILEKGGSAVESAIAALFCEGVSMPQSMGLGGGFLMTIYTKETGKAEVLNCREVAPLAAHRDMYDGNYNLSARGALSVAVPGELRCYWEAYKKYGGTLPWRDLVQPTIDLCKNGILVTNYLANLLAATTQLTLNDAGLKEIFIDPATNSSLIENQKIRPFRLIKTLEIIAEEGGEALNNGSLTEMLANDIREAGGIITAEDLRNYKPEWQEPLKVDMSSGDVMYTTPLPGSGLILAFIMNILTGFLDHSQPKSVRNWQRIVETFKFGYGKRTELGDTDFIDIQELVDKLASRSYAEEIRNKISDNSTSQDPLFYGANTTQPDNHGTAHISILAPNGDAVAVTGTINLYFGAGLMSLSTGVILNDEMSDFGVPGVMDSFGLPPSPANMIMPKKRPLSSMCPTVVVGNDGDVKLVIGAAGGSKITTSVALIIMRNLWFDQPIDEAVNDKRLHHQLFPMKIQFEESYRDEMDLVNALNRMGHDYEFSDEHGFSAVTAIARKSRSLLTAVDKRRTGSQSFVY